MTQAELAGGMANAPEARPGKGQLIRDFTLTSTLGQPISLSDYRGHSNLVLIFGGRDGSSDIEILAEIARDYAGFLDEQTQVLAIVQCTREKAARIKAETNLPFPLLVDEDGRIIVIRALPITMGNLPLQFILPTDSERYLLSTERQRDRKCPTRRKL
jgi:peroxiredoxin